MSQPISDKNCHLGFLKAAQTDHGFVGGLLVTNRQGRPLEFQCTTPVRPTRTHQILYGKSLEPYVYTELIGKTLVERLSIKPAVIFSDQEILLGLRLHIELPVFHLQAQSTPLADTTLVEFGSHQLRCHPESTDDEDCLKKLAELVPADADLTEPLERVHDALQETLRSNAVA